MSDSVLLTVSGVVSPDTEADVAAGRRPRADFLELADAFGADLIDHRESQRSRGARLAARLVSPDVVLAWACFRRRKRYATVFTDGEQVGMPFAALCWLVRRRPRHVMIGHLLSTRTKLFVHRLLHLRRNIDRVVVYASAQRDLAMTTMGYPPDHVTLTTFMVDAAFWSTDRVASHHGDRPMICSVGLEFRDYPTLIEAVRDLDVDVVIAASSPWSKRTSNAAGELLPPNVRVEAFSQYDLRQLYADAALVVVPLLESDFQAGITTILEAMAMGRAVVCSRTSGQTDTIEDGVTGVYVPPGDVAALRRAIEQLLVEPGRAERLGIASRAWVGEHADIGVYAARLAAALPR